MIFGKEDPLSGETAPDPAQTDSVTHTKSKPQATDKGNKKSAPHLKVVKFDAKDKDDEK